MPSLKSFILFPLTSREAQTQIHSIAPGTDCSGWLAGNRDRGQAGRGMTSVYLFGKMEKLGERATGGVLEQRTKTDDRITNPIWQTERSRTWAEEEQRLMARIQMLRRYFSILRRTELAANFDGMLAAPVGDDFFC